MRPSWKRCSVPLQSRPRLWRWRSTIAAAPAPEKTSTGQEGGREPLGDVEQGDRRSQPPPVQPEDVGRARVSAALRPDVLAPEEKDEPVAEGQRAEHVPAHDGEPLDHRLPGGYAIRARP